nr:B-cell CLL/lymphoma 9 protein isoform X2 [Ciona intestinalis]|eukprot:XP_018669172.1 B-cell CLL/lymphoma 9 protein isoform X2 [Ciona intestinalis]
MEVNHIKSSTSPIMGISGNMQTTAKIKGNISSSPVPINYNNCSPHGAIGNNGCRSSSPYTETRGSKPEDSNKTQASGVNSTAVTPAAAQGTPVSATLTASMRPSIGGVTPTKRQNLKITIHPNQSGDSRNPSGVAGSNETKGVAVQARREGPPTNHLTGEKIQRAGKISRSNRANSLGGVNCSARRHTPVETGQLDSHPAKEGSNRVPSLTKVNDKLSQRQSPRTPVDYSASDRDSPFNSYSSPSSNENPHMVTSARAKAKGNFTQDLPTTTTVSHPHRMSRTSSSNSVSDLSMCSEVTDENGHAESSTTTTVSSLSSEISSSGVQYMTRTETSEGTTMNNELRIENELIDSPYDDDTAIVNAINDFTEASGDSLKTRDGIIDSKSREERLQNDKVGLSLDDVDNFRFPDATTVAGDIGPDALNLSAEDIQQTLNSVSAETNLNLGISQGDSAISSTFGDTSMLNNGIPYGTSNVSGDFQPTDISAVLSPSLTTVSIPTSSTASIVTTVVSSLNDVLSTSQTASSTMVSSSVTSSSFSSEGYHSNSSSIFQHQSTNSSTSVSFSPSGPNTAVGRSHLQEILGETDTNRLKNMARPIDSTQYHATTSTSFSSNIIQNNNTNPYVSRSSSLSDVPHPELGPGTPLPNLPPTHHHRFTPPGNSNFQRAMHQRMPNPPHHGFPPGAGPHGPMPHGFELMNQYHEHGGPRPGVHFEPGMHPGGGYNVPSSPQSMPGSQPWQRQGSMGGMMSPHTPMSAGPMGEGNKSPRGPGNFNSFPPKSGNPICGLQSTVNSIPDTFASGPLGSMTKNNNNNMGPPHGGPGIPTPMGMGDFGGTPPPMSCRNSMLPPPSPSILDKRSMSAEGSIVGNPPSRSKANKRERGQSADSKDGDKRGKESGPKPKRRKSKSKDESKKNQPDSKARSSSVSDVQNSNPYLYIFNSEMANNAANMVTQQKVPSIISYHHSFQGNCRLLPSKNTPSGFNLRSPHPTTTTTANGGVIKTEPKSSFRSPLPMSGSPMVSNQRPPKSDSAGLLSPLNNRNQKAEETKDTQPTAAVKQESEAAQEVTNQQSPNSQVKNEGGDKNLSDEQIRHRMKSLNRIQNLKSMLLPDAERRDSAGEQAHVPSSAEGPSWATQAPGAVRGNYAMTRHLEKVRKMVKATPMNAMGPHVSTKENSEWFRLVQAYNEEKRRTRMIHSHPDNMPGDLPHDPPPPYNPGGPQQRWMAPGHPIREPGMPPNHEMVNPRFPPHMGLRTPVRIPHDRLPPGMHQRMRYMVPSGGPGGRMPIYTNQPSGMVGPPNPSSQRLPGPHNLSNEAYPFSAQLKKQAARNCSGGMRGPQPGFDIPNPGDPTIGGRLSSPEWSQYPNAGIPHGPRLSHMGENVSPPHGHMEPGMMMTGPGPLPSQPMEPGIDSRLSHIDSPMSMRMNNPSMCLPYNFTGKGPGPLPNYPETSIPNIGPNNLGPAFPSPDMQPPGGHMSIAQDISNPSSRMMDTMARRGEPRPPDLIINPIRSPLPYQQAGRHPAPSPSMVPNPAMGGGPQFIQGDMTPGMLPQASPHHSLPRSPTMMNSPGMMKSPMTGGIPNQGPYMGMGPQVPMQQMTMERGMMQGGPPSSVHGVPPQDWNSIPPSSLPPQHPPSSITIASSNHGVGSSALTVKDTSSPPPLSHMNGGPMMSQEPPPLSHNPNSMEPTMPLNHGGNGMMVRGMVHQGMPGGPPSYDPGMQGPRTSGPRMLGPMDAFPGEYTRSPSQPGMPMSPSMQGPPQGMMQSGMMEMHGPPSGYMMHGMMGGGGQPPNHHGNGQGLPPMSGKQFPPFDLTGIIPTEKPSQTLNYFPGGGNSAQENQMEMPNNPQMLLRIHLLIHIHISGTQT